MINIDDDDDDDLARTIFLMKKKSFYHHAGLVDDRPSLDAIFCDHDRWNDGGHFDHDLRIVPVSMICDDLGGDDRRVLCFYDDDPLYDGDPKMVETVDGHDELLLKHHHFLFDYCVIRVFDDCPMKNRQNP